VFGGKSTGRGPNEAALKLARAVESKVATTRIMEVKCILPDEWDGQRGRIRRDEYRADLNCRAGETEGIEIEEEAQSKAQERPYVEKLERR
jgi:hypothetical protein